MLLASSPTLSARPFTSTYLAMNPFQRTLNTKMDEFMHLSLLDLTERRRLIEEYITLVVTNIDNHPQSFADNQLRRSEVCSMRTLAEVFQHRIDELRQEKPLRNVA